MIKHPEHEHLIAVSKDGGESFFGWADEKQLSDSDALTPYIEPSDDDEDASPSSDSPVDDAATPPAPPKRRRKARTHPA